MLVVCLQVRAGLAPFSGACGTGQWAGNKTKRKNIRHISSSVNVGVVQGFFQRLVSRGLDMLDTCGQLDVRDFVPSAFAGATSDPSLMFTANVSLLSVKTRFRGSRAE